MKSVISASRRTDIPAFYLNWLMDIIKIGRVEVTNPFFKQNKRIVNLDPDHVSWIVFWSRNFAHFIRNKEFFRNYNLFFHFTILPKSILEKSGISLDKALYQIRILAETYGPNYIIWRYDPIVHWIENKTVLSNHDPKKFDYLCRNISGFGITRCYFSFVQPYQKYERRFARTFKNWKTHNLQLNDQLEILKGMTEISAKYNILLYSCCNDMLLKNAEIKKGHCIDGGLLNLLNTSVRVSIAKTPSRKDCGCTRSIDIGDYLKHPCRYGCIYCYANPSGY
jgi:hypothetical protein